MRALLYSAAICGFVLSAGAAFAKPGEGPRGGPPAGVPHGPPPGVPHHGPRVAPAPEMGASLVGLAMAGALVYFVARRRRNAHA